jgi:DNA-directed RNA polymerase specialized sigma24 family protein
MDTSILPTSRKLAWKLTQPAFERFLNWLDCTEDTDGRGYLEIRARLVNYFYRKNCLDPDELADEVLNRVARRLEEDGFIESETPAKYCYTVARYVFLESLRSPLAKNIQLDELSSGHPDAGHAVIDESDQAVIKERMMTCLDSCAEKLDVDSRKMIFEYYVGSQRIKIENRRRLADKIGISINALSIRACRVRSKLESCVQDCVERVK